MVEQNGVSADIAAALDSATEWLIVEESGQTFPINRDEISFTKLHRRWMFETVGDLGFSSRRILSAEIEAEGRVSITFDKSLRRKGESISLIPRLSAADSAANIELARLEKTSEIASLLSQIDPNLRVVNLKLAQDSHFAELHARNENEHFLVWVDIAGSASPELMLTSSLIRFDQINISKNYRASGLILVVSSRSIHALRKAVALLKPAVASKITCAEIQSRNGTTKLVAKPRLTISQLWRGKTAPIALPDTIQLSETASKILALSPDEIDVIQTRNGETLRFHGLNIARVRQLAGNELAWFGVGNPMRQLNNENFEDFTGLLEKLKRCRRHDPPSKRNELYRASPESWLESILKRNIRLLDSNLILAPIYNQFRTLRDRIDLLALRSDGRLIVIEIKASPDRELPFQAADYWRKIELLRRNGEIERSRIFGEATLLNQPALIYAVAPALSFHRDFDRFAQTISSDIELWRFELHEDWRENIKVIARRSCS